MSASSQKGPIKVPKLLPLKIRIKPNLEIKNTHILTNFYPLLLSTQCSALGAPVEQPVPPLGPLGQMILEGEVGALRLLLLVRLLRILLLGLRLLLLLRVLARLVGVLVMVMMLVEDVLARSLGLLLNCRLLLLLGLARVQFLLLAGINHLLLLLLLLNGSRRGRRPTVRLRLDAALVGRGARVGVVAPVAETDRVQGRLLRTYSVCELAVAHVAGSGVNLHRIQVTAVHGLLAVNVHLLLLLDHVVGGVESVVRV